MTQEVKITVGDIADLGVKLDGLNLSSNQRVFLQTALGTALSASADVQGFGLTASATSAVGGVGASTLGGQGTSAGASAAGVNVGASSFGNVLGGFAGVSLTGLGTSVHVTKS